MPITQAMLEETFALKFHRDVFAWKLTYNNRTLLPIEEGDSNLIIRYSIHERACPKMGKLFCFSHFKYIKPYVDILMLQHPGEYDNSNLTIFRGVAHNIGYPKKLSKYVENAETFWQNKSRKKRIVVETITPINGTISCDWFLPQKVFTLKRFFDIIESINDLDERLLS